MCKFQKCYFYGMAERAVQKIKCARARYCIHPVATTKLVPLEFFFRTSFFPFFKFPLLYQRARYWCTVHTVERETNKDRAIFVNSHLVTNRYSVCYNFYVNTHCEILRMSIKSGKKSACAVKQNYKKRVGVSSFAVIKKHDTVAEQNDPE